MDSNSGGAGVPQYACGVYRDSSQCMGGHSGGGRHALHVDGRSEVPVTSSVPPLANFYCRGMSSSFLGPNGSGIGKCEVGIVNVVGSEYLRPALGSGMLLGLLGTPSAFLEAVSSAWSVTRACL